MHPNIQNERPGMCPECGTQLVPGSKHAHDHTKEPATRSHDTHAGHKTGSFLQKFWVTLLLALPILAYSDVFRIATGVHVPRPRGIEFAILALGSAVFFYGGWVFVKGAYYELRARLPGMMTLIALAISAAYLFSVFQVLRGARETLFWELSTLIAIMLLGHWIEMRSVQSAQGALKELARLLPDTADVVRDGKTTIVLVSELREGDIVLIKPGAKVPADGSVIEGRSDVNESIITGESKPVLKTAGDEVIAGSINGDGSLQVRVTDIGERTFLAGVMRLVAEAESSKSRLQILSDTAAFWLTILAVVAGTITFIAWLLASAGIVFATERLVAVLVIACPHALGLAVPLVAAISTTKAAQNGFLIKRRLALEAARNINVVLFDKTGTLTKGEFGVIAADDGPLRLAAAVEAHSEHPIGKAIVHEAEVRRLSVPTMTNFRAVTGLGVEAEVENSIIFVGHRGGDEIVVEKDGKNIGTIAVADTIRPEAKEAIKTLRHMGVSIAMITGDSQEVATAVAKELGIDEYFARVRPGEKSEKVRLLQSKGKKVAMVGDGVNDAPALTQADLGVAIGAGTNVAIESAGIILVRNDPRDIPKIIMLSKLTYAKMLQNLFWATGYNLVALPLAAGVLYAQGIVLQPAVAAIFMSLSTVIVAVNAVLLRGKEL